MDGSVALDSLLAGPSAGVLFNSVVYLFVWTLESLN